MRSLRAFALALVLALCAVVLPSIADTPVPGVAVVHAQECPNITPQELAQLDPQLIMWWAYWTYGEQIFDQAAAAGVTDAQGFVLWLLGQLCV